MLSYTPKWFSYEIDTKLACPCCGERKVTPELLRVLDLIRASAGPMTITSGYRCPEYNDSLSGSVPDSAHTKGLAADISCTTSSKRHKLLSAIFQLGHIDRIGIGASFIHIDIDPDKPPRVVWEYSKCATP